MLGAQWFSTWVSVKCVFHDPSTLWSVFASLSYCHWNWEIPNPATRHFLMLWYGMNEWSMVIGHLHRKVCSLSCSNRLLSSFILSRAHMLPRYVLYLCHWCFLSHSRRPLGIDTIFYFFKFRTCCNFSSQVEWWSTGLSNFLAFNYSLRAREPAVELGANNVFPDWVFFEGIFARPRHLGLSLDSLQCFGAPFTIKRCRDIWLSTISLLFKLQPSTRLLSKKFAFTCTASNHSQGSRSNESDEGRSACYMRPDSESSNTPPGVLPTSHERFRIGSWVAPSSGSNFSSWAQVND